MSRVTQRTDPDTLARRLVASGARAAIAIDRDGFAEPLPVLYRRHGEEHWIGALREALQGETRQQANGPGAGEFARAVLVLDDGLGWFDLRAVTWRGRIEAPATAPFAPDADVVWLRFIPRGAVAWDYGQLHEESGP